MRPSCGVCFKAAGVWCFKAAGVWVCMVMMMMCLGVYGDDDVFGCVW